jgi:Pvc16 N-terminal domain
MNEVLEYIRRELRYRLELPDDQVLLESAAVLSDRSETRGATISVVNFKVSAYQGSGLGRPDLLDSLELFLLFSFRFRRYDTSLQHLYRTIRLFHERPTHISLDALPDNPLPAQVEKLFFTLIPIELEDLNGLWETLGGFVLPSALYSLRMVRRKQD